MKLKKTSLSLSALLVLGGCPGPNPPNPPPPTPQLGAVTVTCDPDSLVAGQSTQCTASATNEDGGPVTTSFSWTSSNESVAKVDSNGKVSTLTAGTVAITASATAEGVTKQGQDAITVVEKTTLHAANITGNETWRAADNPHVVRGHLEVTGASAPTLTLEAGVTIRFEQDAELRVTNGSLQAPGTPANPIRMVSSQSAPTKGYWRGLVFATAGSSSAMDHVTLSDCGNSAGESACIAMKNQAAPILRDITVQNSGTAGIVVADDGSAFGTGASNVSISGSEEYAVRIGANQAGTLPTNGTFTGNASNAVELRGHVVRTQTWPKLSIPYVIISDMKIGSADKPKLTLLPGTEVRIDRSYEITIGRNENEPGALFADGAPGAPVRFVVNSPTPEKGAWSGLNFWYANGSKLDTVIVSHAGTPGNLSLGTGNVNVFREIGPFIFNSTFSDSFDCGITISSGTRPDSTEVTTDHTEAFYANTFTNNENGAQCVK